MPRIVPGRPTRPSPAAFRIMFEACSLPASRNRPKHERTPWRSACRGNTNVEARGISRTSAHAASPSDCSIPPRVRERPPEQLQADPTPPSDGLQIDPFRHRPEHYPKCSEANGGSDIFALGTKIKMDIRSLAAFVSGANPCGEVLCNSQEIIGAHWDTMSTGWTTARGATLSHWRRWSTSARPYGGRSPWGGPWGGRSPWGGRTHGVAAPPMG